MAIIIAFHPGNYLVMDKRRRKSECELTFIFTIETEERRESKKVAE
jgi:hypothetical protein